MRPDSFPLKNFSSNCYHVDDAVQFDWKSLLGVKKNVEILILVHKITPPSPPHLASPEDHCTEFTSKYIKYEVGKIWTAMGIRLRRATLANLWP